MLMQLLCEPSETLPGFLSFLESAHLLSTQVQLIKEREVIAISLAVYHPKDSSVAP